jgi:hypothetical protein
VLTENSVALENVRTLLAGDSCQAAEPIGNTAIEALISYLEAGNNLSNGFATRKNHILSNSTNSQAKVISLCIDPESPEAENKRNHC